MRRGLAAALTAVALGTTGCTDGPTSSAPAASPSAVTTSAAATPAPSGSPSPAPRRRFDPARAMRTVRTLAGDIGPRLTTGPAFGRAASYVERRLRAAGYDVRRQGFPVPAGDSWGVPVEAGRSFNVVAAPAGFDPSAAHTVVGAHLDTVAVAPGAEDNASGVAVLLEVARVLGGSGQVVLVAFGGEEPRGPGDLHHFGSRRYVAGLDRQQRAHLRAMVALDRVGVGATVPLASAPGAAAEVRDRLAAVARGLGVPAAVGTDGASDHESFADAGLPAARIGSTPYAGYHSAADLPPVVGPAQLSRVGRLLLAWLRAG
jgi:hypothetical protein